MKKHIFFYCCLLILLFSASSFALGNKPAPLTEQPVYVSAISREIWDYGLLLTAFLDVGQGDAIAVITPSKKTLLIDTGESRQRSKKNPPKVITDYFKSYGIDKIDCIVLTHPHSDHIGGAADLINNFEIGEIWDTGHKSTSSQYFQLLNLIKEKNITYRIPTPYTEIEIDSAVRLIILHSAAATPRKHLNANNTSIVIKLIFNNFTLLTTGDIENPIEKKLVDEGADINAAVLKVPHHGSSTSSASEFIKAVNPKIAVISAGRNNKYRHPEQSTLNRYKEFSDITLYRTDQHGSIEILTDGNELKIKLQRPVDPDKLYRFFNY